VHDVLKGIPLPSLDKVAIDALAILSATPNSISPNGQHAIVDCLYTNGTEQLHTFLLIDLTNGIYSTNYNAILGLGDETSVKSYNAAVSWDDANIPKLGVSYEDLTDQGSAGIFNRIGIIKNEVLINPDLIEEVSEVVADGSITRILIDDSGSYIAFETAATNLSPVGSLDTNTASDVYLLDALSNTLKRVSVLEDGTEPFEESKLQDISIVGNKISILFSTAAAEIFSADDTNTDYDLYLWRDGAIKLISSNSENIAEGYDGGIASFFGDEIGFVAIDLIESDTDGLADLYFTNTLSLNKRVDSVANAFEFNSASDLWIEGGNDNTVILGLNGVAQGSVDLSNQLLALKLVDGASEVISVGSNGSFGNDISFGPAISEIGNTTAFQTSATNLVSSLDSLAFAISRSNTIPDGELRLTNLAKVGQTISVDTTSFDDPDGFGSGLTYTWVIDGNVENAATGNTLLLTSSMADKEVVVAVDYSDNWGTNESKSLDFIVKASNDTPSGTLIISGTTTEGQVLTVNTSSLADADGLGTLSYQWLRDGADIAGATSATYTPAQADVGAAISTRVSYTDGGGTAETVTSSATSSITNVNDTPSGTLIISGTTTEGQVLTVNTSSLADEDGLGTFSYQWKADGTDINGATSATLTLEKEQVGKEISVNLTYTDQEGTQEAFESASTNRVVFDETNLAQTFVVTVAQATSGLGNRYVIDNVEAPALQLEPGKTYAFDLSDSSTTYHPLDFNLGNENWVLDIIKFGDRGTDQKIYISIPQEAPGDISYYCTAHSGMGNTVSLQIPDTDAFASVDVKSTVANVDGDQLSGVTVSYNFETLSGEQKSAELVVQSASGVSHAMPRGSDATIKADKSVDTTSEDAIGAFDALQALRLAVGLDKSDGTSEWHDYIAADINKDGRVGADDALNILKYAVGLTDGPSADWVFVDKNADWSGIDRSTTTYNEGIQLSDITSDTSINMTGILVGDVDGSYIA
jgi:hypothetical protein